MITKKGPPGLPIKEVVARYLRSADLSAKEGRYDDALAEIQRALSIDPQNYYARSFQDRIRAEIQKHQQKVADKEKQEISDDEKKLEAVTQLLRNADQFIAAKDYSGALKEVAKVYKIDPQNYFASSYSDRIEILMSQAEDEGPPSATVAPTPATPSPTPPPPPTTVVTTPPVAMADSKHSMQKPVQQKPTIAPAPAEKYERASLLMYRQMLKEMWFDGKITAEEDQELQKVRQMFSITPQEHEAAEKQVHLEAYINALKTAWRDGVISQTENEVLQLMRQRFNISSEEHKSAESQILWVRSNNATSKGTILIAEDDRTMLLYFSTALKKHGYESLTAESIDKAIKLLEQTTPMLILSDLMFGPGEKSGLEFYQYVRSNPRYRETPFLLMSAIDDEFVVRAGVRMGVDEFLKKPFSIELLLATIEGKVKSARSQSPSAVSATT